MAEFEETYMVDRYEMDEYDVFTKDCIQIVQKKISEMNEALYQMEDSVRELVHMAHMRSVDRFINGDIVYKDEPADLTRSVKAYKTLGVQML